MKIFVLEDSLERIELFRIALSDHQVTYCDDVKMSKYLLLKDKFDIIFFDHDLGGKQYVDSKEENTGYQLAKFCKEKNIHFDQICIHSHNPQGSINIENEVENLSPDVKRIPFGSLIDRLYNK